MNLVRVVLAGVLVAGCAGAPPAGPSGARHLLAYDDGNAQGEVAFPDRHYEALVRFTLPAGKRRLARLWLSIAQQGSLRVTFYDQSPLDSPGLPLHEVTHNIGPDDVSKGNDGRWFVVDLAAVPPHEGVLWVGVKKLDGEPKIFASRTVGDQYFVRSSNPSAPLDLLPVRRTPLVRLELAP